MVAKKETKKETKKDEPKKLKREEAHELELEQLKLENMQLKVQLAKASLKALQQEAQYLSLKGEGNVTSANDELQKVRDSYKRTITKVQERLKIKTNQFGWDPETLEVVIDTK